MIALKKSTIVPDDLPGLAMTTPFSGEANEEARPNIWPPSPDWVIVRQADGEIVSKWEDSVWQFGPWVDANVNITFGDDPKNVHSQQRQLSRDNGFLLRVLASWWLYGPDAMTTPRTLKYAINTVKPAFSLASEHNILVSDLYKHPQLVKELIETIARYSHAEAAVSYFHRVLADSEKLGFFLLNAEQIASFVKRAKPRNSVQNAYIPKRIWTYQYKRTKECIDDFLAHKNQFKQLYERCVSAYANNADLAKIPFGICLDRHSPFSHNPYKEDHHSCIRGDFWEWAKDEGADKPIEKWVLEEGCLDSPNVKSLSTYLSQVVAAGVVQIVNISMMRISEANSLRVGCLSTEQDVLGLDVFLLSGNTTKNQKDNDANWIVTSGTHRAVEAMTIIAEMRAWTAQFHSEDTRSEIEKTNPALWSRAKEPWISNGPKGASERRSSSSYSTVQQWFPKLLNKNELLITEEDYREAQTISPEIAGIDRFQVGNHWPLGWHQLRRTGSVLMMASETVEEVDLCYQLKHLNRAMSRYYANNWRHLSVVLNKEASNSYTLERYAALSRKLDSVLSEDHVSPNGHKRKKQLEAPISASDHKERVKLAKAGKLRYHETFLGGCMKPGDPCPLGGISNIAGCMGGSGNEKPCEFSTVQRSKREKIIELSDVLRERVKKAPAGSILAESLGGQLHAAEKAIGVIDDTT